jgi:hypothetical protein
MGASAPPGLTGLSAPIPPEFRFNPLRVRRRKLFPADAAAENPFASNKNYTETSVPVQLPLQNL